MVTLYSSFLYFLLYPLECINNFSLITTFHSIQGVSRNNNARQLFDYTDKFINRYMAEGIIIVLRLRSISRLQYLSITHTHIDTWLPSHYTKKHTYTIFTFALLDNYILDHYKNNDFNDHTPIN